MLDFIKEVFGTFIIIVGAFMLCAIISLFIDIVVAVTLRIGGIIFMIIALLILASILITLINK